MPRVLRKHDDPALRLVSRVFVALPLLVLAGGARPPAPAAQTLCKPKEVPLFTCTISGKVASVCAAPRSATYRFGRPGRVELEVAGGRRAQRGYSGGGETQVTFDRAGWRYVVYDRTVRTGFGSDGRHDPEMTSGVLVLKDGKIIADRRCTGGGDDAIDAAGGAVLPEGPFTER